MSIHASVVVTALLCLMALLSAVPAVVFFVELAVATLTRSTPLPAAGRRVTSTGGGARIAVLMPAHNEASGIAASIAAVLAQCGIRDRVLVVADNCNDLTAKVARDAGAEVIERHDMALRGKGYALDFGVRWLEHDPPDVVVIVDADCIVEPGALGRLQALCLESGRPVQALYLMQAPRGSRLGMRIAEFAWIVKNRLRPRGCALMGAPCQLTGSGMALPWNIVRRAGLATGHLVEDMQLGVDLARVGNAPLFCEAATVRSSFPSDLAGVETQRTRWEHGHLAMLLSVGPSLFGRGLVSANGALMAMALDLMVPPLSSLVLLLAVQTLIGAVWWAATSRVAPLAIACAALALVAVAVAAAWNSEGRKVVGLRELLGIPLYVVAKVPVYFRAVTKRQVDWVRTRRDDRND